MGPSPGIVCTIVSRTRDEVLLQTDGSVAALSDLWRGVRNLHEILMSLSMVHHEDCPNTV